MKSQGLWENHWDGMRDCYPDEGLREPGSEALWDHGSHSLVVCAGCRDMAGMDTDTRSERKTERLRYEGHKQKDSYLL